MSSHQPLLQIQSPKPSSSSKALNLILCLVALLFSASFVANRLFKPNTSHDEDHWSSLLNICDKAYDRSSCIAMASEVSFHLGMQKFDGVHLLRTFLTKSNTKILHAMKVANELTNRTNMEARGKAALADCVQLMELSMDRTMDSNLALRNKTSSSLEDAHVWLSSVLTNHVTCFDELEWSVPGAALELGLHDLIMRARNSLGMLVSSSISSSKIENTIESLFNGEIEYPSWLESGDRKLLEVAGNQIKANLVVAKDGSGNFKTIKEAVQAVPNKSKTRFVIYIKKGTYKENIEVGSSKKNVMLVGDGMNLTIITGSLNKVDGSTTFKSATLAAVGDGFIAQDIWFKNTAGPQKYQAVALRVGSDKSAINRCRIDAYQDTLYTHSNRQFYRDSTITGTVDFIFGNAAAVLQNCIIEPRRPMSNQANMVTAQSRTDPNQNTGISIQKCQIVASNDLNLVKGSIKSYLGRPWQNYSRTVVMQTDIGDAINPAGWSEWDGDFALKTLYYGEYANTGPGADLSKRVKWPGFHVMSKAEAQKFTVTQLIQGNTWLGSTGVPFTPGL